VANGTIYTTIGNPASLEAFDDATGTPKWTIKLSKGAAGTAITLTNELVFASTQRGVFVLNKRGIVLNKLTTYLAWSGGSHATVVNGHVFFYGCGKRCAFAGWGV
jgi:outer membrane protein assembly factor BamB